MNLNVVPGIFSNNKNFKFNYIPYYFVVSFDFFEKQNLEKWPVLPHVKQAPFWFAFVPFLKSDLSRLS